jgi:hypothetical protein
MSSLFLKIVKLFLHEIFFFNNCSLSILYSQTYSRHPYSSLVKIDLYCILN